MLMCGLLNACALSYVHRSVEQSLAYMYIYIDTLCETSGATPPTADNLRNCSHISKRHSQCMRADVHVDAKCQPARTIVDNMPEWTTLIVAMELQS